MQQPLAGPAGPAACLVGRHYQRRLGAAGAQLLHASLVLGGQADGVGLHVSGTVCFEGLEASEPRSVGLAKPMHAPWGWQQQCMRCERAGAPKVGQDTSHAGGSYPAAGWQLPGSWVAATRQLGVTCEARVLLVPTADTMLTASNSRPPAAPAGAATRLLSPVLPPGPCVVDRPAAPRPAPRGAAGVGPAWLSGGASPSLSLTRARTWQHRVGRLCDTGCCLASRHPGSPPGLHSVSQGRYSNASCSRHSAPRQLTRSRLTSA